MPRGSKILGQPINEEKWAKAKERAAEEGHGGEFDYIMQIYKHMAHLGEYTPKNVAYRKKKKMKVPVWREKTKYSPKQYQTAKKSGLDTIEQIGYTGGSLRLVLAKGSLDEFRCGVCKVLLFKGRHLHKSFIEVKCRNCGTFNVNRAV